MSLDLDRFQVLTFDCYGTLIDWETGILRAVRAVFPSKSLSDREVLENYGELEPAAQAGAYKSYREILREVMRGFSARFGVSISPQQESSLAESVVDWIPFPDTVDALKRLSSKYRLGIISNIDDDLFAQTAKHLKVDFAYVITAQQARSYKPSLNNFRIALQRIGLPKEKLLHAAESVFHDVVPTRSLGISNVWVNRWAAKGYSATKAVDAVPDLEVPDLRRLAELAGV